MRPVHSIKYIFSSIIFICFLNSTAYADPPTDIDLSSNSVFENLAINSVVGLLTSTDPDGDTDFTYSLVSGTGSAGNANFNIQGSQLRTSAVFDYETQSSYSIRIRTNDGAETYDEIFIITILNVNEAPEDIILSSNTIAENVAVNTLVGAFSTSDPDGDAIFTYTLVTGTGSTDNSSFRIVGNQLRTDEVFDFEDQSSYSIRVRTSDGNLSYQKIFSITVTDENEAPDNITLSSTSVQENQPINTVVGTLSSTDPDGDISFTYALVSGTGSTDNGSFNILGSQLRTSVVLDSDVKPSCLIRIRSTDGGGESYEEQFIISVTDINEPPVLNGIETSPLSYTEDDPARVITSAIQVSDPENDNMVSATIRISGGFNADEDRLSFVPTIFDVDIDDANGVLTITGSGTIAQYQTALRNVRYLNINQRDPSTTNRTIQFVINDGAQNSLPVYRTIEISDVNDPPDVQDDTYGGVLEGGTLPVNISNGVLTNDEDLDGPVPMIAILEDDVQYGVLSLASNGSFSYTHDGSNELVDGFTYYASDGDEDSELARVTITMIGANDPPELTLIESSVLPYIEDDPPRQITATLVVSDEDNLTLESAIIRIDNNFISTEDSLTFTPDPSLTISYIPATGIINVSGEATLLAYQNFLRSIRYVNTNELKPSTQIRRVIFSVNDGTNNSIPVYRYINITPKNDPPIATDASIIGTDFYINQLLTADYTYTDPDGDLEGNTTFRWYMADDDLGTGRTLINTSQQDTLTPLFDHGGKWIQFVVRPYDILNLVGEYDTSEFRYINAAPELEDFTIINEIHPGAFAIDEIVLADYSYFDEESDSEGEHTFQWYRSNTGSWNDEQAISNADDYIYTISPPDNDKYIALEAVAYATDGSSPGQTQYSEWHLVSETPSAIISGDLEICEGSTDFLTVTLTGSNPPWSFRYVIEGTTDTIPVNNIPGLESDYQLEVADSGTYLLVDVSDEEFDFGIVTGTGSVLFLPQPSAELVVEELSICDNDEGIYSMPVELSGTAPWSISYTIVGQADSVTLDNIDTTAVDIEISVDDLGIYRLLHVWDANCMASGTGTTEVILRDNPRASITGDNTVCPGDTTELTIDLSGGGPWTFYYTLDDGDEIAVNVGESVAEYQHVMEVDQAGEYRLIGVENKDDEGCAYGTALVENFIQPSASITGDITICEGTSTNIPVTLTGTSPWTITYQHNIEEPVVIESVTQNPYLLQVRKEGSYTIPEITDFNSCIGKGVGIAEITVDLAPQVTILERDTIYTVSAKPIPLHGSPEGGNFDLSDPSTVFLINNVPTFVPLFAGSENSPHRIIYAYQDPGTGCFGNDTLNVYVLESGGTIAVVGEEEGNRPEKYCFNRDTMLLYGLNEQGSKGRFTISGLPDGLIDLGYLGETGKNKAYLIPGNIRTGRRTVTYHFELSGQQDSVKRDFYFEEIVADFSWDHECFTAETLIKLTDHSHYPDDSDLDSNKWEVWISDDDIKRADTTVFDIIFDKLDTYPIEHVVVSKFGCSDTIREDLVLKPTYSIHTSPYSENFDNGKSDWIEKSDKSDNPISWMHGAPAGNTIMAPDEKAWYTDIADYSAKESSYVISPCFDFSNSKRPMIKMKIWQDFVYNTDGANLQYKAKEDESWLPVGIPGEGENWFNSQAIQGLPGGTGSGWTEEEHNDWQNARHKLDNIPKNRGPVRFRIAYGAPANDNYIRDGFAFDDIWIGERTKKVLIEHFTNMGVDNTFWKVDSSFNKLVNDMEGDIIDLQYHAGWPAVDTFYSLNNSSDSRELYYTLPSLPYAIIDGGGGDNNHKFLIDFNSENLEQSVLDLAVLKDNDFDVLIRPEKGDDYVNIDLTVTSLKDLGQKYLTVHIVIVERMIDDVVSNWGDNSYESVVRAMLPDAVGTSYNINWGPGTSRNINLDYHFEHIFDIDEVRIVAFVQDNDTREIYQAAIIPADPALGVDEDEADSRKSFLVYPNPACAHTNVEFYEPIAGNAQIQILDNAGRLIRIIKLNDGDRMRSLYLGNYDPGIYFVRLIDDKEILGTSKLLILGSNK